MEDRYAWIDGDEVCLYLSGILFWVVRTRPPDALKAWWESGEMPYPEGECVKVI